MKIRAHSERYHNITAGVFEFQTFMSTSRFHCHRSLINAVYVSVTIPSFFFFFKENVSMFFFVPFIIFALMLSLLPIIAVMVTQIRGHTCSRLVSPPSH